MGTNRVGFLLGTDRQVWYQPQQDITTHELALIIGLVWRIVAHDTTERVTETLEGWPQNVQRHFEIEERSI